MDEQARAAYLQSQSVCALIEAMGMFTQNTRYHETGVFYRRADFLALFEKYGIHHNGALSTLRGE